MFPFGGDKVRFYPGDSWVYYKIYMGPMAVDDWLRGPFRDFLSDLDDSIESYSYFFVRYMDPDFHIRLRIKLTTSKNFVKVISNMSKALLLLQFGDMWKVEIGTYTREIQRYGKHIESFERAFYLDSVFWTHLFEYIDNYDDFENIRWKLALRSMYLYYHDLMGQADNWIPVLESCIDSLQKEINPTKSFLYQTDQKFRDHQDDLEKYISGEKIVALGLGVFFRDRSKGMKKLFGDLIVEESFFTSAKGKQNITDLVHMSLNRGLRSKHRVQEFVLYRYLLKLVKSGIEKGRGIS